MERNGTSSRESTGQRIESALRDDIAAGQLEPGERLDETKLAERFAVSRTPVREALSRLTAQGVLVAGEKRGVRVAQYSREELAQMFEAMQEIESICARLANQRLTLLARAEIEAAQESCKAAAAANDRLAYIHANEALHMSIYRATDNPYIRDLASDFRRKTGPFRAKKLETKADLDASVLSHEELLAKIFSGDSQVAVDGMRKHMTESFMRVLAVNN
ncbi:GntR family transcriptional regulator [Roseobacter sp. CCS2]|uniref:GntR family transcriptional regulator n=1 Tax=Roseobacter sp. CCS2 TaxID=391593 RepID=UPI0000F401CE|nr:GntR family transcriptional regulator [Roseobacter sp. CCS2]EBA14000.1 transcriptional regulator, GntR family protein [Roseobacter sp. CCS2]